MPALIIEEKCREMIVFGYQASHLNEVNMFNYIFEGKTHTDTSEEYMLELGMSAEQIESVLRQKEYDEGEGVIVKRKAAYALESDHLFLEWQYDKTPASEQRWRNKVLEIKNRLPI